MAIVPDAEPQAAERVAFRRPTRKDAVALARERFLAGDRVEMNALADELDIGRTTLYRWVGEREQLIGEVFGGLVDEWLAAVEPDAVGAGLDRFLDVIRRYLGFAAASEPLTAFAEREPALALRILMDRDGPVARRSVDAVRRLLAEADPRLELPADTARAIVMVAIALVWGNVATGQEPAIDDAVALTRTLVVAAGAVPG